jgi:hypothetical protein
MFELWRHEKFIVPDFRVNLDLSHAYIDFLGRGNLPAFLEDNKYAAIVSLTRMFVFETSSYNPSNYSGSNEEEYERNISFTCRKRRYTGYNLDTLNHNLPIEKSDDVTPGSFEKMFSSYEAFIQQMTSFIENFGFEKESFGEIVIPHLANFFKPEEEETTREHRALKI